MSPVFAELHQLLVLTKVESWANSQRENVFFSTTALDIYHRDRKVVRESGNFQKKTNF